MTYFDHKNAAERYSKGRPDFQTNTISRIKIYLHFEQKLEKGLDGACGTGWSLKAWQDVNPNVD